MLIKPWTPLFDASRERVDIIPIWVRLPAFPLQYWEEKYFKAVGNMIGEYLEADKSYIETKKKKIARILVNINVRDGLGEELDMTLGTVCHTQKLDYENVPFRCRRCHEYGHLVAECKLPLRIIKRKSSKERTLQMQERLTPQEGCQENPITEVGKKDGRENPMVGGHSGQSSAGPVVKKGRPNHRRSCMNWVHPTLPLVFPTGIPSAPSSSLSDLLHNLNLNLDSNRWVESLNAPFHGSKPLALKPLELKAKPPSETSLSGMVLPDKTILTIKGNGSGRSTGYFLRSKSVPNPDGGIGMDSQEIGSGRGRKSFISKAKNKARSDMLAGKQLSIERALRARAQELGSK